MHLTDTTIAPATALYRGPGSSVGIATDLRAGRTGIESRWGRDFPSVQTGPGAHPASCTMGTGSFLGVKWGRGVLLTTHSLLVSRSWKSRAIPVPTFWATPSLYRDHFTSTFTALYQARKVSASYRLYTKWSKFVLLPSRGQPANYLVTPRSISFLAI